MLSPEPGSLDFQMLLDPAVAQARAQELGLSLPDRDRHEELARRWRDTDLIDRESAMADYVESVMPGLTLDALAAARAEVRQYGKGLGVTIGG
ncbi:hypothetical protein AB0H12_17770 [Actinosynnema sp. NPDC023794]